MICTSAHVTESKLPASAFGTIKLADTFTSSVVTQPLTTFVIVIVYKPASFTTGLYVFAPDTMPGPVHDTVTPYVLLLPSKLIVGFVQLMTVSTPALAFGDTVSIPTTTASVDVQPLIGCVAVTVYVVGTDTFVTAVFAPFDHANVAPDVLDVADKFKLVLTQFTTVSIPAFTPGAVKF